MAFVITRLCRDCVDMSCMDVCPKDCILEHRPENRESELPNQLFIDPEECIDCRACVPACPWEAIYDADDVPDVFRDDIELNARAQHRADGYDVPVRQLVRRPRPEEVAENRERWGIDPIR